MAVYKAFMPRPHRTALLLPMDWMKGMAISPEDASGNANTGTISGATWITSGRYGNALSFDGTGGVVTINDASSLDLSSEMALEAWVYVTKKSGWKTVIGKKKSSPWTCICIVRQRSSSGSLHFPGEEEIQGKGNSKAIVEYMDAPCCDIRWGYVSTLC